jgi:outer membrane protein insertion porin family
VEIEPTPDTTEAVVDIVVRVNEGPQQIVRELTTQGEINTRPGVISRTLRIRPGDPVNLRQWSQARKRLYDTNVFRQVDIEPIPIEPTAEDKAAGIQPVRAVVRVIEYPLWRLRYGLQLNDERTSIEGAPLEERQQNLGILADLRNQNLFGRAFTAGIAGRYERDRRSESLFISNASFFGLPLRSNAFIFDARQRFRVDEEVAQITDRRGLSYEQRWRPSMRAEITYGYRFERNHTFDPAPDPDDIIPFDLTVNVSKLTVAALLDRRDDPFEPSRGWFTSANWDEAVPLLGSDYKTAKLLTQGLYFVPVNRLVLATRAQVGIEFSSDPLLPTERFFLGGATTVRGYGENTLGPFDDILVQPAGGDGLFLLNAEARFPVRGWVQGVAFVDAGNVFEGKRDFSLTDLKVGYGIGLRLASPFAMLRADVAFPASAVRPGEPKKTRFYFGIGHIF